MPLTRILEQENFYVIAEIGINHNGSLDEAMYLVEQAALSGVHAVKFQKRELSEIYIKSLLDNPNSAEWSFQYLLPQLKELELSKEDYHKLKKETHRLGLDFIVTPFDHVSADFVISLDIDCIKFSSADLTNWPLIQHTLSKTKMPAIFSTGMWEEEIVHRCSNFINTNFSNEIVLLLCQSTYPAPLESLNLNYLETLKTMANIVGYSGHERGLDASILALALGAQVIEKHITRDSSQLGPDHKASLTPKEFTELIRRLKEAKAILGENKKIVTQAEILNKEVFAKSAVVIRDMLSNEVVNLKDIKFMSPGKGITPDRVSEIIGKPLKRSKKAYDYLTHEDFEQSLEVSQWPKFDFSKPWGIKCRFHDYNKYKQLETPLVEFHCSEIDVTEEIALDKTDAALVMHAPEVIGKDLFDLCSDKPHIVDKSIDMLQKTIKQTRKLSTSFNTEIKPKIVLHVGGMSLLEENLDSLSLINKAEKVLRDIDLDQVDLLPENLPPRPWYLGGQWHQYGFMRPQDMAAFCDALSLGMTFDICHAQLYCKHAGISLLDYAKIIEPYIKHVHLSDAEGIAGEGLQIGDGEIDFDSLFNYMEKIQFSWVPEIWSGHENEGAGTLHALGCMHKYSKCGAL